MGWVKPQVQSCRTERKDVRTMARFLSIHPPHPSPPAGGERSARRSGARWSGHAVVATLLGALWALALLLSSAAMAQPKFPALTGRIVDEAGLLSAEDRRAIEQD